MDEIPYPVFALYELAFSIGVDDIAWYPDVAFPRARYVEDTYGHRIIFLNPMYEHDEMRLRCILAHEVMHAKYGIGADRIGGSERDEAKARREARKLLMPDNWITQRLHLPAWELCELAGVYQRWAEARIRDMERELLYA